MNYVSINKSGNPVMKSFVAFCLFTISVFSQWIPVNSPPDMRVLLGLDMNYGHRIGTAGGWQFGQTFDVEARLFYTPLWGADWLTSTFPDSIRAVTQIIWASFNLGSPQITHIAVGARNLNQSTTYMQPVSERFSFNNLSSDAGLRLGITGELNAYRGVILTSSDYGQTWQKFGTLPDSCLYVKRITKLSSYNDLFIIASFPGGDRVLHSSDLGNTWITKLSLPNLHLNDIVQNCFNELMAVGGIIDAVNPRSIIYLKSSWSDVDTVFNHPAFTEIKTLSTTCFQEYIIAGDSGMGAPINSVIYQSTNGLNWQKVPFTGANILINRIKFIFSPWDAGAIMLADSAAGSNRQSIIYTNAPNFFSKFTAVQHLQNSEELFLFDAHISSYVDTYVFGLNDTSAVLYFNNNSNLPVELTLFYAEQKDNSVYLTWETASEINNRGFEIERKTEGAEYSSIAFIAGKGSSTQKQKYTFTDTPDADANYTYRLKQVDFDGRFSYSEAVNISFTLKPSEFYLSKNYPNPFNPETKIDYGVPVKGYITLAVYDILGNRIAVLAEGEHEAGNYSVVFNAETLSSGTYIYRLTSGGTIKSGRMTLLK